MKRGRSWLRHAAALAPALVITAAIYAPALGMFFAQDDITFLSRATGLAPTPWSLARPLSEALAWRALHGVFGLDPAPYHAVLLLLHLASLTLVYAVGFRLLESRAAAAGAAVLFGASASAFTPLHWVSCIVESLATVLALGALWLYLEAKRRDAAALLWLSAVAGIAAALTKESTIVLPLALAVVELRGAVPGRSWRSLMPHAVLLGVLAGAFVLTLPYASYRQYAGGGYAIDLSPAFLFTNLSTYLKWCVALLDPIPDRHAAADPASVGYGIAILILVAALAWRQRGDTSHPFEIGAAWFALFLLPVLPLASHTYLYYLYLPWAGACWLLAAACARATRALPRRAGAALAISALSLFAALELRNVRTRETAMVTEGIAMDRTVRESTLIRNAVAGVSSAGLAPGTRVGFVNLNPGAHYGAAGNAAAPQGATRASYLPLEAAMRDGETLRLLVPGVVYAGFVPTPPPNWDDVEMFLFRNDGTLHDLGRGAPGLAQLAEFLLRGERPREAEPLIRRAIALGDTSADTAFDLLVALSRTERRGETREAATAFIARWPGDRRVPLVRAQIEAATPGRPHGTSN